MATVANTQTKINGERTPLLREKLRRALAQAGPDGRTVHQLAQEFYGESNYATRRRVFGLVIALRRDDGVKVVAVKDRGFLLRRFVLAEYVIAAELQP